MKYKNIKNIPEKIELDKRTNRAIEIFHKISKLSKKFEWRVALLSGFAIDAHFGYLTKNHRDVDIMMPKDQADLLGKHLEKMGHDVYEAEKFKGECLKVDQADPKKDTQAHCDIHYFWEENKKVVIPLLGKKLIFSKSFNEMTTTKEFLGEKMRILKPKYLLEEKIGWCKQIGLSQCKDKPEEYKADINKINLLTNK
ncbi:MAG: hypothetical protein WD607_08055 [Candidatus Paceibacterota bacterium]